MQPSSMRTQLSQIATLWIPGGGGELLDNLQLNMCVRVSLSMQAFDRATLNGPRQLAQPKAYLLC